MAAGDSPEWWLDRLRSAESALEDYVVAVEARSEREVKTLLRCLLVHSGTFGLMDRIHLDDMRRQQQAGTLSPAVLEREHSRQLILHATGNAPAPWEGITWILDCLPYRPADTLTTIGAFIFAHAQDLPDGALDRLQDAQAIIRAYYIGLPGSQPGRVSLLASLDPRGFECVIWRLYEEMGYQATLTQARKDGGRDVIARRPDLARSEDLRIECKKWAKPVTVEVARSLLGIVSAEKANKGVIVSPATFTRGARQFATENPRIELISGSQIVQLLNEHLGARWPVHIDKLAAEPLSP